MRQHTTGVGAVLECCERARALEYAGQYEAARELLSVWWRRVGERPNLEGLNEREAAEVTLRVSCLTIWLGSARQVEGAQELALDLLSECARTFDSLGLEALLSEAQIGLAHAYLRKASYDEARVVLKCVLGKLTPESAQVHSAIVMLTIAERSAGALDEAMRLHERYEPLFQSEDVPARLKATFYYNWAVTHRKIGNIDEALLKYAVAKKNLEETGDTSRLAIVETALGFLFYTIKSYAEALDHTREAISLYEAESNKRGVGEANETLSHILVDLGDYAGAELAARAAVNTFRGGEEKALFVEALTALGTALARQGRRREAHAAFGEAEEEALNYVGQAAAAVVTRKAMTELVVTACLDAGLTLEEPVNLLEKEIIRAALKGADKSMKVAAIKLGVEYDTLRQIIKHRHPDLQEVRTPITPRRRGVVNKKSSKVRKLRQRQRKN